MSLFNSILEKLGIHKPAEPVAAPAPAKPAAAVTPAKPAAPAAPGVPYARPAGAPLPRPVAVPVPARPVAIPVVDVISKLDRLAASKPGLDWKVSIVDLLTLLGIDSSYNNRKELAVELGCPADMMNDSASMNIWLHKTVLQKIANHGGNIPPILLH
jgi:hypothetical protein